DVRGTGTERRFLAPDQEQLAIELAQLRVVTHAREIVMDARALERLDGLRIGNVASPAERLEFLASSLSYGLDELRIGVAHEVEKWRGLAVFLAHEDERDVRREEQQRRREPPRIVTHERVEPVAGGAITNLIVILNEDDEVIGGNVPRRRAVLPAAMRRVGAVEGESAFERLDQRLDRTVAVLREALIVSRALAGEQHVHGVVKVVAPLRVHRVASALHGSQQPRIVQVALGDHLHPASELRRTVVYALRELGQDVLRAEVEDAVDRIEAQRVDVK